MKIVVADKCEDISKVDWIGLNITCHDKIDKMKVKMDKKNIKI